MLSICQAKTLKGKNCKNKTKELYCHIHIIKKNNKPIKLCYDVWTIISSYLDNNTFLNIIKVNKELNTLKIDRNVTNHFTFTINDLLNFRKCEVIHFPNIIGNINMNDNDLIKLNKVYSLDLNGNKNITIKGLKYLKEIKRLDLTECSRIIEKDLEILKDVKIIIDDGISYEYSSDEDDHFYGYFENYADDPDNWDGDQLIGFRE